MRTAGPAETPDLSGLIDVSPIGAGGFADVYRARQAHLGRWVALKVFRVALHEPAVANQFRAECQAVSRLDDHLHVIRVYDAGLLPDGRPYLVTELCDSSLQQLVVRRGGALPELEAVELGYRVAIALLAAHSAQVIHGDVTPQNVLIRSSGAPVLADFGLAVLRDYRGNTASGFNPAYAAPEALSHEGRIDERTDVYGLGATLYAMLTGRAPFGLQWGESEAARNRRVLEEPVSWPAGTSVSDRLEGLVSGMLAKEPGLRPELSTVADELTRLGDDLTQPHAPPAAHSGPPDGTGLGSEKTVAIADAPPAASPRSSVPRMRAPRPERSISKVARAHPRLVVIAAVSLILAGGILVSAVVTSGTAGDAPPAASTPGVSVVELAPPDPLGALATRLSWSGTPGLTYTLVVTRQGEQPRDEPAGEATTVTVATEPSAAYCFQVRGTDGRQVVESNVQRLRDAVC
ncbi:serine/threonine protein kinase [Pseudonocardia hierapolitana]|uniref:non-specific serine/threonine protein kinase n=1 Tax=Pseudonocardia hierapolitana TaxID=1128676 RepID=A0A561SSP1_9PSEU|nr:protein kinase [Pseudonocardia hierapolitana]TWF77886.1 serine/threonine protein kinase [Pseudonocardia hierapolitana]